MALPRQARNARADARNAWAPPGEHWCSEGRHYAPVEEFAKNRAKEHGLHNRCRKHEREYRERLEAKQGKRHDVTRTLRVEPRTHELVMRAKGKRRVDLLVWDAVRFYLRHVCVTPGCLGVGERTRGGRCQGC